MKSESVKMLRFILIAACFVSVVLCQNEASDIPDDILANVFGESTGSSSAAAATNNKLSDSFAQFSSTKERPELNPILSELIGEDIKKSIEAKRQVEQSSHRVTTFRPTLTTDRSAAVDLLSTEINDGLVDQSISLDEAGSENKQTSRIQIKKGPNGVDYEYEYVYYYYDEDDEKDAKKSSTSTTTPASSGETNSRSAGKNRYTAVSRGTTSTTAAPEQNEVPQQRGGKGRASIPVVEEVSEERLPLNTRFPPRSVGQAAAAEDTTKKIAVRRPSLELVDSQSFNRDDKNVNKGNRQTEQNEFQKSEAASSTRKAIVEVADVEPSTTDAAVAAVAADSVEDATTPLMEKVAFDLYAILANENSNADATTELDAESSGTTVDPELFTDDGDSTTAVDLTTVTSAPSTSTTTTTTAAPATTRAPSTTSTTTTTTTAATPAGRKSPFGGSRNRFRFKSGSTEAPAVSSSEQTPEVRPNRFGKPSFGGRGNAKTTAAPVAEAAVVKEDGKSVAASPIGRGRTRNRFNLRASTTEKNVEENAIESSSTTTQRSSRPRPSFQMRSRTRPAAAAVHNEDEAAAEEDKSDESGDKTISTTSRPSRFNIGRPNRLLGNRQRSPALKTAAGDAAAASAAAAAAAESASGEAVADAAGEGGVDAAEDGAATAQETSTQTGLNRLKNRPRIQIQSGSAARVKTPAAVAATPILINRKVNPLISRRKLNGGPSTTAEPSASQEDEQQSSSGADETAETKSDDSRGAEESTESIEASSEQPRGLGLLGNRRRLQMRRPGTIL